MTESTKHVPISKRLAAINSASTILAMVLEISVLVWVQQYLVRRISPEEYSLLPILTALMMMLPLLSHFLTSGMGRFVTMACARQDWGRVTVIVSSMLPYIMGLAVLALVAGVALIAGLDHVLELDRSVLRDARIITGILLAMFIIRLVSSPFVLGLFVYQKFVAMSVVEFSGELIRLGMLLFFFSVFGVRVLWVAASQLVASLCVRAVKLLLSHRELPSIKLSFAAFDRNISRGIFAFGGWLTLAKIGTTIYRAADPILLNRLAFATDVASFHLGGLVYRRMSGVLMALTGPLQPAIMAMHAHNQQARMTAFFYRIGRLTVWVLGLVTVPLFVLRVPLARLYLGPQFDVYASVPTVLALLSLSWIPFYSIYGLDKLAVAQGKLPAYTGILIGSQVANLVLTVYFLAFLRMGAVGSALASLVSSWGAFFLGYLPLCIRTFSISLRYYAARIVVPGFLPWVVGAAVCHSVALAFEPVSWLFLGLASGCGMAAYLLTVSRCLHPDDKRDVRRVITALKLHLAGEK